MHDIAEHGREAWQVTSVHRRRALVGADISRWTRVIGGILRSRVDRRRMTEVGIALGALNHMLELGCPTYVRIAQARRATGLRGSVG